MEKYPPLSSLSADEIKALPIETLVKRMDDIRYTAQVETYGVEYVSNKEVYCPMPKVVDLMGTLQGRKLDGQHARRLADAAFRYLLQMDMLFVSSGISNQVVYGSNYDESAWHSPRHWLRASSLEQYKIVASRIALECFFDLIHIADCGKRMSSGNSKFKSFRKWVMKPGNRYKYFVGHIIKAFEFDQNHRQKEVHGTSRFAQSILRLERPDSRDRNIPLQLTNVLLQVWTPLIQIMNGDRPSSISVFDEESDFADQYFKSRENPEDFEVFIGQLLENRLNRRNGS